MVAYVIPYLQRVEKGGRLWLVWWGGLDIMSRKQKLLDKICRNIRNTSLGDFEELINVYGYIEEGSKHPRAIIGNYTMPYKRENPMKSCYVKELVDIIDSL
jgi:hypothetical protein